MQLRNILPFVLAALLVCVGMPAVAQDSPEAPNKGTSWSGRLVDSDCRANSPTAPCEVSETTANFGLLTSNDAFYKLDSKGNQMAKDKLKGAKKEGAVNVKVTGKIEGETIVVNTLNIG